ncbi:hypothetical protein G3O08_05210 [Cryomorpha ignava]|uniref:Spondin domain-containing protein n=1 Tax=Cryomorpha ignava TaxID=101383 RepID=A0A7K3WQ61_9FLAO|nr:spondin domain-containing protein [Cryomorpha ignava]NEN22895.1 hypothetical protein [Cryomorpha ignava]
MKKLIILGCAFALILSSCNSDDEEVVVPVPTGPSTFQVTIENVDMPHAFFEGGVVNTPVNASAPGPLFPDDSYEITFQAGPHILPGDDGPKLSFVTMFVQSNDLFLSPNGNGIALYDDSDNPIGSGAPANVTSQVLLWDAGTEVNEVTGGPNQKPQQDATAGEENASDVGEDENGVITLINNNTDGVNDLPNVEDVIYVEVEYLGDNVFKVRFENVSNSGTIAIPYTDPNATGPVPMSPFVWGIHTSDDPFFSTGITASEGIENIAEDGDASVESARIADEIGVIVPLSPGAWAVHETGVKPMFENNIADFGEGLEAIAEDGAPDDLAAALSEKSGVIVSGAFTTPVGASDPGAIGPGQSFTFSFDAEPGDRFSIATMFVQSNDWFYAFPDGGITLFNGNTPVSGNVTESILLYDAGTEVDQYPGSGPDQVIRQENPNTGAADADNTVRLVENAPSIVPVNPSSIIKVTITPQ